MKTYQTFEEFQVYIGRKELVHIGFTFILNILQDMTRDTIGAPGKMLSVQNLYSNCSIRYDIEMNNTVHRIARHKRNLFCSMEYRSRNIFFLSQRTQR